MNHKKKKPKNARAGCLLCKPHKMNGVGLGKLKPRDRRELEASGYHLREVSYAKIRH